MIDVKFILEFLVSVFGVLMSLGYYPQAYTIWKERSSKDVSLLSYMIFAAGTSIWTIYGIYTNSWMIIISFFLGAIGSWTTLILILKYRKKK